MSYGDTVGKRGKKDICSLNVSSEKRCVAGSEIQRGYVERERACKAHSERQAKAIVSWVSTNHVLADVFKTLQVSQVLAKV